MRTRKNIYQIKIVVLGNILYCYLIGQNLSLKGMFTLSGLIGDDAPRNLPTYESSIDYIPTLSIAKELSSNTFLDAEWSYRLKKDYSGDSLYNKIYKNNRLWARYSSEKIEARLGLQKIIFGPTQILRSLSWFDTFDIKDPTGQTDGVEAFRLRWFPSNSIGIWTWAVQNDHKIVSYGGRGEISTLLGEWGITFHHDPTNSLQMIGQTKVLIDQAHNRMALDFRYDGFIGFWNESAFLFSKENNIALVTIGADYTLPIATGIMLMTESMLVKDYQIDSNSTQTALMASVPLGMVYQLMFIYQFNWEEKKNYNFLRLTATYDQYALNFIISINPKRSDYNEAAYFLPNTVAGFGTNLKFVFMYNH
ncbi:MAG: hypothetical protein CMG57_05025 [Candidatus Marinimicrobia bacterium]|nr:hypothetical protein [Candidatus Neomarinimicrobiota bacterium]